MGDFFDRRLAVEGEYYIQNVTTETGWTAFPRQIKARILEARSVRSPRIYVAIRGGSGLAAGETVFDVGNLNIRMGFEDDTADRVLAFSTCSFDFPKSSVTNAPTAGDRIVVQIGVDPVNRTNAFMGAIENVRESGNGRSYEVIAFDEIRRLMDYPFEETSEPVSYSDVDGAYVDDYDETTLEASVQIQVSELLSAADVLTHSLTGIEQYPIMPSNRSSVYEELSVLLRSANCRAYLSPSGRLLVTYTDEMPLWAVAMMSDMGSRPYSGPVITPTIYAPHTYFHLPLLQVRALFPDRMLVTQNEEPYLANIALQPERYPEQLVNRYSYGSGGLLRTCILPPFEFTPDNTLGVERIEDSEILNEVRARVMSDADVLDFISGLAPIAFEDLDTLTFAKIGDAFTSFATGHASVAEYGLRWRTYNISGLSEFPRPTKTPTGPPATTQPSVNYGRYAMYRGDFAESQMRARQFPVQRLRLTAPGILSLLPFEIVSVNLPNEGVQGYFQIEARRISMGSGGFRTVDTLRRMDLPEQFVSLDVRDEAA